MAQANEHRPAAQVTKRRDTEHKSQQRPEQVTGSSHFPFAYEGSQGSGLRFIVAGQPLHHGLPVLFQHLAQLFVQRRRCMMGLTRPRILLMVKSSALTFALTLS